MEKITFTSKDGTILKGKSWAINNPIANVVIFEGMEEHLARYDKFALLLNSKGFSVYGLDMFGQGDNVKEDLSNIGVWPDNGFNKLVDIDDEFISSLKVTGVETFIFAHSFGSFVAQAYLERHGDNVKRYILSGAGFKQPGMKIGKLIASLICLKNADKNAVLLKKLMFGTFNDKIAFPYTSYDWLSYNKDNVIRYINDPLCGFGSKNKFCLEFLKGMNCLYSYKNTKKVSKNASVLLVTGAEDPVSNYSEFTKKLCRFYKNHNLKSIDARIYPQMRHEILNEDEWEVVCKDIVIFFSKGL